MRFLVDECASKGLYELLSNEGYDSVYVRDWKAGATDEELVEHDQAKHLNIQKFSMSRTTISISSELKRKLGALKGEKTWDEFLSELLNSALSSEIRDLEDFLRETSGERDIPFERVKIRLRGGGWRGYWLTRICSSTWRRYSHCREPISSIF